MSVVAYCPTCRTFKLTSDVEGSNTCPQCHQKYIFTDITQNKWVMKTADEKRSMLRIWFGDDDFGSNTQKSVQSESRKDSNPDKSTKLNPSFWMTGSSSFEGFDIIRYLGIYSGQNILVKGTYPDLQSVAGDMTGDLVTRLSAALEKAKIQALCNLQDNCIEAGANAAICVSLKISTLGDVVTVTADATAVCIERSVK